MVGVIGMPAALADEPALAEPVVGMNVAACGTFLRAMVRRDDQEQNVVPGGLVFGIDADPPPCALEDGPVESGLGSCAVAPAAARLVGFALGAASHGLDFETLHDHQPHAGRAHERTTDLVGEIVAHVFGVGVGFGDTPLGLAPAGGAFDSPRHAALPAGALPLIPLHPALLHRIEVVDRARAGAGIDRVGNATIHADRGRKELRLVPGRQLFPDLVRARIDLITLGGKGYIPAAGVDAQNEGCR